MPGTQWSVSGLCCGKNQLPVKKGVSVRAYRYTKFANKVSIRYSLPICNMSIHTLSQVAVGPREL
jgi:hypothetical protein